MKSKKWKVIRIKDLQLKQLRDNLRTVLKLAIHDERERLRKLWYLYVNHDLDLTPSQVKRKTFLDTTGDRLSSAYSKSILRCSSGMGCMSRVKEDIIDFGADMGWVPLVGEWVCAKCHDSYYGTKEARRMFKEGLDDFKAREDFMFKYINHSND